MNEFVYAIEVRGNCSITVENDQFSYTSSTHVVDYIFDSIPAEHLGDIIHILIARGLKIIAISSERA